MDVNAIRADFPVLDQLVHGKPLVYLDSAATSQKPRQVIQAINDFYAQDNANVHRAIHTLGERATEHYEGARVRIAAFIGAPRSEQCIFVRNTTEAINLVAYSWAHHLQPGDEILTTTIEHHSNLVPWQQVVARRGAVLKFLPLLSDGQIDLAQVASCLNKRTRLVAIAHVSNVMGTINPVRAIADAAHAVGARILVDGAQSVPHIPVDVKALDCDFMAFSGHKMAGPTGIGVLYGKTEALAELEPFLFGGDMIASVSMTDATWNELPWRLEAGTPNIAGAIGLGAAVDYLSAVGMDEIARHTASVVAYAVEQLQQIPGLSIYGPTTAGRSGLVSFNVGDVHPHDVATFLDQEGVAVRAGHHCAQPAMCWLQVPATTRASFYLYNTKADVDSLVAALKKAKEFFGHVS